MPPLPHFTQTPPLQHYPGNIVRDFVRKNLYEFEIVDLKNDVSTPNLFPSMVKFVTRKKKDLLKLTYFTPESHVINTPLSSFFKDVFCGLLQLHDENGLVFHKELIQLDFYSSEMEFDIDKRDVLTWDVSFKVTNIELVDENYKLDRVNLIRNYKLNKLL
jgi:hypothetical protein